MTNTALLAIERTDPAVLFADNEQLEQHLEQIAEDARKTVHSIDTLKGRKAIASHARSISSIKTSLDGLGKGVVEDVKKQVKEVDAKRKAMRDKLDALRDEIRQPLTDWEEQEKAREAALKARLIELERHPSDFVAMTAEQALGRLEWLDSVKIDDSWQEYTVEAARAKDASIALFRAYHQDLMAEAIAEADKQAAAKAAQAEREQAIAEQAAEAERKRIERQAEHDKRQALQKSRDIEHRKAVNNDVLQALVKLGIKEDMAKALIKAIVGGNVPHVTINY